MMRTYISDLLERQASVSIFLTTGVKLQGNLRSYEAEPIPGFVLERNSFRQFINRQNICTIMENVGGPREQAQGEQSTQDQRHILAHT